MASAESIDTCVLDIGGNKFTVPFQKVDGINMVVREGLPAQLGKRYICGQDIEIPRGDGTTVKEFRTGTATSVDGHTKVYFGCETQVLCVKAPATPDKARGVPYCCSMPMSPEVPRPLPSSD